MTEMRTSESSAKPSAHYGQDWIEHWPGLTRIVYWYCVYWYRAVFRPAKACPSGDRTASGPLPKVKRVAERQIEMPFLRLTAILRSPWSTSVSYPASKQDLSKEDRPEWVQTQL
jgi:hypothetical protein